MHLPGRTKCSNNSNTLLHTADIDQCYVEPYLPIKYIVDLFPNVRSQPEEFAVYPMQYCLEEIPFSWVFAVKQFQQLQEN